MYNFKDGTFNKPYMGDDDKQCYSNYYICDSEEILFKITYTKIGKTLKCGTLHADNSMYIQNILIYLLNSINLVRAVRDSENQKDKSKFYIIVKDKNLYEIGNFDRNQIINPIISLNLMILLMMCGDTGALLNPGPESNKHTLNTNRSPDRNTNMHITRTQERGRGMERGGETRWRTWSEDHNVENEICEKWLIEKICNTWRCKRKHIETCGEKCGEECRQHPNKKWIENHIGKQRKDRWQIRRKELENKGKKENEYKNSSTLNNKRNEKKEQGANPEIEIRNRYEILSDKSENEIENEMEKLLKGGHRGEYRQPIKRKDDKHKEINAKRKKYREMKEKWKMYMWNARGLVTRNTRETLQNIQDDIRDEKYLIVSIMETWFGEDDSDEGVSLEGFNIYRADRKDKTDEGGAVIYVNDALEAQNISQISKSNCEMVAVRIPEMNLVVITVYRPPSAKKDDFKVIIEEIDKIMQNLEKPEPNILINGDFNFSFIEWEKIDGMACRPKMKMDYPAPKEAKEQYEELETLCGGMVQVIDKPTREGNILELLYTNEIEMIAEVETHKARLSDHNKVIIQTEYEIKDKKIEERQREEVGLRALNLWSKNVNWKEILQEMKNINWMEECREHDSIESTGIFYKILTETCEKNAPKKRKTRNNNKEKEEIRTILNRIKFLKRKKRNATTDERKKEIDIRLLEADCELVRERRVEKYEREVKLKRGIKSNAKMIHGIINKKKRKKRKIGPFKKGNRRVDNDKELTNIMKDEYTSQYSEKTEEIDANLFEEVLEGELADIEISEKEIMDAIDKLDENSAAGPDGVPAYLLIKTKEVICKPLAIILRKSLDEGKIADIMKLAYITPIHKGGSRQSPGQYRPVSLTSHVMKIFERVIQPKIIEHLVKNKKLNKGQHGFVPNRSTQTQLICHYNEIYEAVVEEKRIDTVYLDFAKAFDKVDHSILIKKVKEHGIGGKIGKWLIEFLTNRKFRVVANGSMSDEGWVKSGVPQGTVLAAILFVIMISDIDDEIKKELIDNVKRKMEEDEELRKVEQGDSEETNRRKPKEKREIKENVTIVTSFADDTRVSRKISGEEDRVKFQRHLNMIYRWAERNKMVFNAGKFEQIAHGRKKEDALSYKNPEGKDIEVKRTIKDLGVWATNDLMFKEHIDKKVKLGKVASAEIMTSFGIRERETMLLLYKAHVRPHFDYGSVIWSPTERQDIRKIERVQAAYTKKIKGMENLDYYERLEQLNLHSMERRRDRYYVIYAWQQIRGKKENVMGLELNERGRTRIRYDSIPYYGDSHERVAGSSWTKLLQSPKDKATKMFNCIPDYLKDMGKDKDCTTETFKRALDNYLKTVPDQPNLVGYGGGSNEGHNSLDMQARFARRTTANQVSRGEPEEG